MRSAPANARRTRGTRDGSARRSPRGSRGRRRRAPELGVDTGGTAGGTCTAGGRPGRRARRASALAQRHRRPVVGHGPRLPIVRYRHRSPVFRHTRQIRRPRTHRHRTHVPEVQSNRQTHDAQPRLTSSDTERGVETAVSGGPPYGRHSHFGPREAMRYFADRRDGLRPSGQTRYVVVEN